MDVAETRQLLQIRADVDADLGARIIPRTITTPLFVSHFLSTWNARVFEFGAILFIAGLYPDTLLPASLYALARGISAVCFSPTIGRFVDRKNRLHVVRVSIVAQRAVTAISCVLFLYLTLSLTRNPWIRVLALGLLAVLACIEKLCSIMNLVAVERDWAVVIAGDNEHGLQALNSQMRRIDLFCKLVGPLAISLVDSISTIIAICVVLGLNLASVAVEYFAIAKVYTMVDRLQHGRASSSSEQPSVATASRRPTFSSAMSYMQTFYKPLSDYLRHPVALPSLALSILYFTVLSFAAQMVTYLLNAGYDSSNVGLIRAVSVVFEISATWLAPLAMGRVGPVRAGLWFINWQLGCVGVAVGVFWFAAVPGVAAAGLIIGVILSRVGLWGFDLCVQFIVQEEVDSNARGSFSAMEASFQNAFELLSFAATVVFSRPADFRYPVLMSAVAVFVAAALYAAFVRSRRGHLVHISGCLGQSDFKIRVVGASAGTERPLD